ncbi:MAG: SAM-dependent chlorinase/fluorinase, partial [Proteobacteria bacterium]|nr:SAM-dependent chlorinase/fluorinase [Pseudomonadota bacterium]
VAYNEIRGVVLSNIKDEKITIEPLVPVAPFSIINGNFILRLMAESYPENTIFSIILNPSKERPARLIGKTKKKNFYFIGANTGVFTWFLKDFGIKELYELNDPGFVPFGGKYVHAPAVAHMAMGKPLNEISKPFNIDKFLRLNISEGTIVHIDNFGLMKFTGDLSNFNEGDELNVNINGENILAVYATRMMSQETGKWVIYPGSSLGLPELGKVRRNGAKELDTKIGDMIKFNKLSALNY